MLRQRLANVNEHLLRQKTKISQGSLLAALLFEFTPVPAVRAVTG